MSFLPLSPSRPPGSPRAAAMDVRIATPEGYRPNPAVLDATNSLAQESGSSVMVTADPVEVSSRSRIA